MSRPAASAPLPVVAPLLLATMVAVHALGLDLALRLDAPDLLRALLCHVGHGGATQLLWAGLATACLALALEARVRRGWLLGLLAASAVGVSAVVVVAERAFVDTYVGSSGVGHALAMAWALVALRGPWRAAAAGLLVAKVAGELLTGGLLLPDPGLAAAGMVAVPAAHTAGVLVGAAWGAAWAIVAGTSRAPAHRTARGVGCPTSCSASAAGPATTAFEAVARPVQ